jgi:large subunit ribosomal protein LP0
VQDVYEDGTVYSAAILDMDEATLLSKFFAGVRHVAALSLAIHYPTAASVSHSLNHAFKGLIAIALETEITFAEAQKFKVKSTDIHTCAEQASASHACD